MIPEQAFYFVRHGQTDFNLEGRFQGSIDTPLNARGMSQARTAALRLSPPRFTRIVSSPANRVLKTASFIAEETDRHMHIESDLMELHVGSFEGQKIDALKRKHALAPGEHFLSILPDDSERWDSFAPKVCAAVARWSARYPDETLLFASHGLVFRALSESLCGVPMTSGNAVPYLFQPTANGWQASEVG